jgi:hypothetical protein
MSDFSLMVNLRAKYAQRDALVLQRVQKYQREIEEPLTFSEVVDEYEFLSELHWEDGVVDDVQAYCAYLSHLSPFGEEDSAALSNALFEHHMSAQETTFENASADLKEDLVKSGYFETEKENSHITA